jgi:hypothetical protein
MGMGNEDEGGENGDIAGSRMQEGKGGGHAWGGGAGEGGWSRLVSEIHGQWRVSNGSCGSLQGRICVCVCVCACVRACVFVCVSACIHVLPDTHARTLSLSLSLTHTHTHTHTRVYIS